MRLKNILKNIFTIFVIFSLLFTTVSGAFILYNYDRISRIYLTWNYIQSLYLNDVPMDTLITGAAKGMVASLNDPYSVFMDATEYKHLTEQIEGAFSGVGLYVEMKEGNQLSVLAPIKGGPAERVGVKAGDVIVKIDEESTAQMPLDLAIKKMKGQEGTEVAITVFRESNRKMLDFKITREKINVPTVEAHMIPGEKGIGYIRLNQFNSRSAEEVVNAVNELKKEGARKLVFDLRDNPGGELGAAVDIASLFIPKGGPVVHIVDKHGNTTTKTTTLPNINLPFVVLINGNSASASEVVAGAVKDTGSGPLIGTKTFGKGVVQNLIPLEGGFGLKLTTAKYLTPNKNDIHKKGIDPDVLVEVAKESLSTKGSTENDPVLAKGIEILKQE